MWISNRDRLPVKDQLVLVHHNGGYDITTFEAALDGGGLWLIDSDGSGWVQEVDNEDEEVFWMALPKPPTAVA